MRDIVKRYIIITVFIVSVLILMNGILLKGMTDSTESKDPQKISHFLDGITVNGNSCSVSKQSIKYVQDNYEWMMVLEDSGTLIYSCNLPKELNRNYTVGEIADYANWYIEGYPVEMMNAPGGLVILGTKQKSIWKKNISIKSKQGIVFIIIVVGLNILITIVLAYLLSLISMKELKSAVRGIFDVSEEKEVTLAEKGYLKEIKKAINIVSKKLTEQKSIIKKSNQMKEEWLAGVSHDIRTPLSVIVGKVEELHSFEENEEKIRQLDVIRNQSFKIKYLVNDLNLINKLDHNLFRINSKSIDINRLLRECIADVMNMYEQDNYEFVMDNMSGKEKLYLDGDEHLLKRAFENILINSIVHNEQGCQIAISVQSQDSFINITFEDNGTGMSEEKIKKINDGEKQDVNSEHGWGTLVVKRIVELHSGKTKFKNSNTGMQVEIMLPQKLG